MKYRIIVSDNENAEDVREFLIDSNESVKDIVKAVTLKVIADEELSVDYVESISFDADSYRYMSLIQCADKHICVWAANDKPESIDIGGFIGLAKTLDDDMYISSDENTNNFEEFFKNFYGNEEKL